MNTNLKTDILYLMRDKLKLVSGDQYHCRCPLCGDSAKNPNKKRFYIKFNLDNDEPIKYKCFNCNESGYLNSKVLRAFSIGSLDIKGRLNAEVKGYERKNKISSMITSKLNYSVPLYNDSPIIRRKKEYVEDRLGLTLSYEELRDLKAVLDISTFIKHNNIKKVHLDRRTAYDLEANYTGFLSAFNDTIIYRNITDSKFKHNKYVINPGMESLKFYTIPSQLNIFTKDPIVINIAEGVYDILGVYFHLNHREKYNMIYAAVTSASYSSILDYYFSKGIFGNVILNIFADRDKSIAFHKKHTLHDIKDWVCETNIIYNAKGKDLGVHKDDIELEVYRV